MKRHDWDALVVGVGPAGSTAAFVLASRGLRVLVLDRRGFPRPKLCGGSVPSAGSCSPFRRDCITPF